MAHGFSVMTQKLSCPIACGILVPRLGTEPVSLALEGRFLTTGPTREVLPLFIVEILILSKMWRCPSRATIIVITFYISL